MVRFERLLSEILISRRGDKHKTFWYVYEWQQDVLMYTRMNDAVSGLKNSTYLNVF